MIHYHIGRYIALSNDWRPDIVAAMRCASAFARWLPTKGLWRRCSAGNSYSLPNRVRDEAIVVESVHGFPIKAFPRPVQVVEASSEEAQGEFGRFCRCRCPWFTWRLPAALPFRPLAMDIVNTLSAGLYLRTAAARVNCARAQRRANAATAERGTTRDAEGREPARDERKCLVKGRFAYQSPRLVVG